ncbi:MAG: hypothetical protein CMJ80_00330 [Planctomycetaceae bacterium]|nr:hypothetical protein [Planctomycetaceae bacterium]
MAATAEASNATSLTGEAIDIRKLSFQLDQIVRASATEDDATYRFATMLRQLTDAVAVLYYTEDCTGQLSGRPCYHSPSQISKLALDSLHAIATRAQSEQTVQVSQSRGTQASVTIAAPVYCQDDRIEVVVALATTENEDRQRLAGLVQIAQFMAAFAGQWRGRDFADESQEARHNPSGRLVQHLLMATQAKSFQDAAKTLANFATAEIGARYVAIGSKTFGGVCRLTAMSDPYQFERGAPLTAWLESGMAESMIANGDETLDSIGQDAPPTEAIRELQSLVGSPYIYRLPLVDASGTPTAACLAVCDRSLTEPERSHWQSLARVIGPQLAMLRSGRPSRWRQLRSWYAKQTLPNQRAILLSALFATIAFFALPFPHRVKSDCEVQPVHRRYVTAPYEGRLEVALAEPGDLVDQGQVLARMDGREVRLEISGIQAKLAGARTEHRRAITSGETATAKHALSQIKFLEADLQRFEDQQKTLEVRSPSDGIVISGDPKKLEGSRLNVGQTLFEVGSLELMIVEVAIPDEDIDHAQVGQPVTFRLTSMPYRSYRGVLKRIHPRSELRDSENVFIGEVAIEGDASQLRPGMRGQAKLSAPHQPLVWLLFHRALEQLMFRLGA